MGNAASSMAAKLAFFPPSPPSYSLFEDESSGGKLRMSSDVAHRDDVDVMKLSTKKGNEIVAMFVKNPSASLTLLYSHGNAADLGHMFENFTVLSLKLNVNLMGSVIFSFITYSFYNLCKNDIYLYLLIHLCQMFVLHSK